MTLLRQEDILYPELSYKIIGCAFEVFNEIGGGHKESVYQKAMEICFSKNQMAFKPQIYYPITFNGEIVTKNFFDFLVEDKIVVELKSLSRYTKANYEQVVKYMNVSKIKLSLLILFTQNEVRHKRVINFNLLNQEKQNLNQNPFVNS